MVRKNSLKLVCGRINRGKTIVTCLFRSDTAPHSEKFVSCLEQNLNSHLRNVKNSRTYSQLVFISLSSEGMVVK